jgi:tryptophan synthase alpha chain
VIPTSIGEAFALRRARGQAALIPYVTAGHPEAGATPRLLRAVADAGADVIELGIPFSDPLADGPTIQRSSFQALTQGATVARTLGWLADFRRTRATPVVIFTYLNPVLRYGPEAFLRDAAASGAQGLLVTDLPTGADPDLEGAIERSGLDLIRLLAPTTPAARIPEVARGGSGFLYYISRTGVTGAREDLRSTLAAEVARVRAAVRLPVAVGFGISTPEQAASVAAAADGVVVGSALIQALDAGGVEAGAAFVASLRRGMDGR